MVRLQDACEILSLTEKHGIMVFLDGGWGVDALIGRETRVHNDIDLFVEGTEYDRFIDILKTRGFSEVVEEYTTENHTVWKDDKDRIVDLHQFTYGQNDTIYYEGELFPKAVFSGRGRIGDIAVNCIEPQSQVMFHLGYEHDENDIHDVMLLCDTFDIPVPEAYR